MVAPPVTVVATLGFVLVRNSNFLPRALMPTGKVLFAENTLTAPRTYINPPKPILANRILAARDPCWPALWISEAATDSGIGQFRVFHHDAAEKRDKENPQRAADHHERDRGPVSVVSSVPATNPP